MRRGFGPFRKYRDEPTRPDLPLQPHEKARFREVKTKFVMLANSADLLGIAVAWSRRISIKFSTIMGYVNKKWNSGHVLAPIFDEMKKYVSGKRNVRRVPP